MGKYTHISTQMAHTVIIRQHQGSSIYHQALSVSAKSKRKKGQSQNEKSAFRRDNFSNNSVKSVLIYRKNLQKRITAEKT